MNAAWLLKADRRAAEDLFEKYEKSRGAAARPKPALQICPGLSVLATIAQEIFCAAARALVEDDMMDEAYCEHDGARMLIAELMEGGVGDDFHGARVKVLCEEIKPHVKEEEGRDRIFSRARKAGVDRAALGEMPAARKAGLRKT